MSPRTSQPAARQQPALPEAPRSLADDLRTRSDAELEALLRARPDLLTPVPADVGQLAVRAATQTSTGRALDRLDRWLLQVLDVVAALPEPTTTGDVERWLGADPRPALATLREQGLLWGPEDELRLVRTARQLLPSPAGLGPTLREALGTYAPRRIAAMLADFGLPPSGDPAAGADRLAAHLSDPAVLEPMIAEAEPRARGVLDRLTWGPAYGNVTPRTEHYDRASADSPVDWLIVRGLLVITSLTQVALPREVAIHLRGGHVHARLEPEPPALEGTERAEADVDRTAGAAAFEIVRLVEDVLEAWSTEPPPVLRAGGLGVRDLRRLAQRLDVEEWHAAFVVELAYVTGLLASSREVDEEWWPTPAYDTWLDKDTATRWAALAEVWLLTTRVAGLVGSRDERDKVVAALGPDLDRVPAPEIRTGLLEALAQVQTQGKSTAATAESLLARLDWQRPRRHGRLRAELVPWTLREAELLGVTGRGALSGPGRALVEQGRDSAARLLAPLLPAPLDHVLLQADLTAVAPGPLETPLAQELALLADVESKGGATVYRFTESSVRRALDAGRSADDLHRLLAERSRTPVPQPLTYLVDDVARRHGRIRVGTASAYVRADDEHLLSEILADRRSAQLRLRRLAPTVLAAQAAPDLVLERLRAMSYAPAAESAEGEVVVRRPDARRTGPRQRPARVHVEPPVPKPTLLAAAIKALRAGDKVAATPRRPVPTSGSGSGALPRTTTADTLAAVQSAIAEETSLWIGYVNGDGHASQRVIDPITVEGGHVSAYDHLRGEVRSFALHRITGVAFVDEDDEDDDFEEPARREAQARTPFDPRRRPPYSGRR